MKMKMSTPKPPTQQPVKLFVATPMYGGMCTGMYASAVMQLAGACNQNGIMMYYSFMMNESLITRARNSMAYDFLESDATHLMFIDADITFSWVNIVKLLLSGKELCGGCYPKKCFNWDKIKHQIQKNCCIKSCIR